MALNTKTEFRCPACGTLCSANVTASINVEETPEGKKSILNGDFFTFTCTSCGHSVSLVYNLLYLDRPNRLMICLVPLSGDADKDFLAEQEAKAAANSFPFWREEGYTLRIVHNPNELREKLLIFDAGFDDRIVEIAKGIALSQCPDGSYITEIRFASIAGQKVLILFDDEGGEQYVTDFQSLYNEMYGTYIASLPPLYDSEFYTVDLNYAGEVLRRITGTDERSSQ